MKPEIKATVALILEQAKKLTPQERKELAKLLIDMMDVGQPVPQAKTGAMPDTPQSQDTNEPAEHWGKSLNQLMDEIGPIEMKYPEIEDPVEWVKHLRAERRRRRLGNWGEEE